MPHDFESHEVLFLTGAGFTHNFGAPLGKEMWTSIFNNPEIQKHGRLRELMLSDYNYESVVYDVRSGDYKPNEKTSMDVALMAAYGDLDEKVRIYKDSGVNPLAVRTDGLRQFIRRFAGNKTSKGFIFTLNQDLFMERHLPQKGRPQVLGTSHRHNWFNRFLKPLAPDDYYKIPDEETVLSQITSQLECGSFFYVKLHGSQNWITESGHQQMVIGGPKLEQIKAEPILWEYFKIFERALRTKNRRLLIAGYGFGDNHINDKLASAVRNNGLKIYILSPTLPDDMEKTVKKDSNNGGTIWEGLAGIFPFTLQQLFPREAQDVQAIANLERYFFQ